MVIEVTKLVWQDVGIGYEVESCLTEPLLHANHIKAHAILACDLVTLRKMVDLLVFIETLILI